MIGLLPITDRRVKRRYRIGILAGMTAFTGFPIAALDFYDDLEMDNTKSYWEAHKPTTTARSPHR